jgi:hypothetical protein
MPRSPKQIFDVSVAEIEPMVEPDSILDDGWRKPVTFVDVGWFVHSGIVAQPELSWQYRLHRYNYSDLPIYDILFGTFKNPRDYEMETGFYNGASARVIEMIAGVDVSTPREPHSGGSVLSWTHR